MFSGDQPISHRGSLSAKLASRQKTGVGEFSPFQSNENMIQYPPAVRRRSVLDMIQIDSSPQQDPNIDLVSAQEPTTMEMDSAWNSVDDQFGSLVYDSDSDSQ